MAETKWDDHERILYDLGRQVSVVEERVETKQAEYKTDIAILGAQMAKRDTEIEKRLAEMAKMDVRLILAVLGIVSLAVAILKFS